MTNSPLNFNKPFHLLFTIAIAIPLLLSACSGQKSDNSTNNKTQKQSTTATTSNTQNQTDETTSTSSQTATTSANTAQPNDITAERGHKISKDNGCFACHSTNGKDMAGPTWKNLYGSKTTLQDGSTVTADSAYIAKSIVDPSAQIVKGFSPTMPKFSYLKKDQIASIIAYIKSISKGSSS
jgi:cytochrome c551/c552